MSRASAIYTARVAADECVDCEDEPVSGHRRCAAAIMAGPPPGQVQIGGVR